MSGISDGRGECHGLFAFERVAPRYLVQGDAVFLLLHQGHVVEQGLGQCRLYPAHDFPVGLAEVGPECKSNLEEELLGKDV